MAVSGWFRAAGKEAVLERSTKESWLNGPGDLREAVVEDVPVEGKSVRVRGLAAAYSNRATSVATEVKTTNKGEQVATINTEKMEVIQFAQGVIDPQFSEQDADVISRKYGPAFKKVIAKIDELSGVDKEAIEKAEAVFPVGGTESDNGGEARDPAASAGGGGSDLPVRVGGAPGDDGG
jgi:hypothetical protein